MKLNIERGGIPGKWPCRSPAYHGRRLSVPQSFRLSGIGPGPGTPYSPEHPSERRALPCNVSDPRSGTRRAQPRTCRLGMRRGYHNSYSRHRCRPGSGGRQHTRSLASFRKLLGCGHGPFELPEMTRCSNIGRLRRSLSLRPTALLKMTSVDGVEKGVQAPWKGLARHRIRWVPHKHAARNRSLQEFLYQRCFCSVPVEVWSSSAR